MEFVMSLMNAIYDYILRCVDVLCASHEDFIWMLLLTSPGVYFLMFRWYWEGWDFFIQPKHVNSKTRRKIDKERVTAAVDILFGKITKQQLRHFGLWLLCKTCPEEEKGRGFPLLVFVNYTYHVFTFLCVLTMILSWFLPPLRWWCALFIWLRAALLDMPLILTKEILFIISGGRRRNGKRRLR